MKLQTLSGLQTSYTAITERERTCQRCGKTFHQSKFAKYCRPCRAILIR